MLGPIVVRVSVIFLIQFIIYSETQKLGDKGVCPPKPIPKFFVSIYNMPNNTAIQNNTTTQNNTAEEDSSRRGGRPRPPPNNDPICCDNYEYDVVLDKCLPICILGCVNGTCVDVNKCECEKPLILIDNTCVQPKCTNCEHGDCVAMNDCRCHKQYIRTNNTCAPICKFLCVNGKCSAPDTCQCDSGYKLDPSNKYNCNPICEPSCVHGYCAAPNKCLCSVGYEPTSNSSVCKPECTDCENGRCDEPNICICDAGYERVNVTCKPKCRSCENGDCIAPEKCRCHDGYNETNEGCKPNCESCTNSYCSKPNYCTCNEGYQKKDTDHSVCYKPCVPECTNGSCDLHGVCICSRDFEIDNKTKICIPVKPIECSECHSNCTVDSEECRCSDGRLCFLPEIPPENAPSIKMAGLDLKLVSIGGACLLLLILVVVVMQQLWHRSNAGNKPTNEVKTHDSVMYTVPHTLINSKPKDFEDHDSLADEEPCTETLLRREAQIP